MSLARLLRSADARLRLDLVRPALPRFEVPPASSARLAPPFAARAVANVLRMELARRDPATRGAWPAERAPEVLAALAPETVAAAEAALAFARGQTGRMEALTPGLVAERALQLARLEAVVRAGYVDARIGEPEHPDDVAEVAQMAALVPWDVMGPATLAPPYFPRFAETLPDAEPDAIVGGAILEVSASRAARVEADDLRALVARLVLARREWGPEAASSRVRWVGVLLARHGLLWRAPVAPIVGHEAFPAVEAWLLERLDPVDGEDERDASPERAPRAAPMPKWVRKRFAKRTPGTHPEGKAEKKKRQPPQPDQEGAPRGSAGAWRDAPEPRGERDAQDRPPRSRSARPDWRRGSAWRRDRGL